MGKRLVRALAITFIGLIIVQILFYRLVPIPEHPWTGYFLLPGIIPLVICFLFLPFKPEATLSHPMLMIFPKVLSVGFYAAVLVGCWMGVKELFNRLTRS
jgi:hypothetical protein